MGNNLRDSRIGERKLTKMSGWMEIIEYNNYNDIVVRFDEDGSTKKTSYYEFKANNIRSNIAWERERERVRIKKEREKKIKLQSEQIRKETYDRTGEQILLKNGMIATIVDYNNFDNITVQINNYEPFVTTYNIFRNGLLSFVKNIERTNMVGQYVINKYGTKAKITELDKVNNTYKLILDNGYTFFERCCYIEKNIFKTPYCKTIFGVGYLGKTNLKERYDSKWYEEIYHKWRSMLERVYSNEERISFNSYKDCIVCERWHNFSNFISDMLNMWYECDDTLEIDKDIKIKGNKVYSPDTCILVPKRINKTFVGILGCGRQGENKHYKGIFLEKSGKHKGKWKVKPIGHNNSDKSKRTGVHKTFKREEDAWNYYKEIKIEHIHKVVNEYKDVLPKEIYDILMDYKIEVEDYLK